MTRYILQEIPSIQIDCQDENGRTALHAAAVEGFCDTATVLVAEGADVLATDVDGSSPLHFAAAACSSSFINLLLDAGADVNMKNRSGKLPIHYAAGFGNLGVVCDLLKRGSILVADNQGITPESYAIEKSHTTTAQIIRSNMKKD